MPRQTYVRFGLTPRWVHRLSAPLCAVLFVAAAALARIWLGRHLPGLTVFSLYYPAILASALIGGELAAGIALVLSAAISWLLLHNAPDLRAPTATVVLNLTIFVLAGAFIGAVGARLRWLLRRRRRDIERLADREARYRALFEGVTEGFALVEGVWNDQGAMTDFIVVEANPALIEMLGIQNGIVGKRQSDYPGPPRPEYIAACEQALRGTPVRLELHTPHTGHWYDIRLSRVGPNRLAQVFVDITDRRLAQDRQSEMFDELNHRVKNNLAAVSAMLTMQARVAEDHRVREQLEQAVDRIEAIADVHASLYRASSQEVVDFTNYLERLCERLSSSLLDKERIRMIVVAEPVMAPLDEAVALGLIVNELVTNAAKYAYPAGRGGAINVSLRNGGGGLVLTVSDHGEGFVADKPGRGIGMRLVRSLVQQCQGELEIGANTPSGACFTVRLREHGAAPSESSQSRLL